MLRTARCVVITTLCAAGCVQPVRPVEQPAVLVSVDGAARTELVQTIRTAPANPHVTLADAALTTDSHLIIERARMIDARAAQGNRLNGRELQMQDQFQLFIKGKQCWLQQQRSERRWQLMHARCVAQWSK